MLGVLYCSNLITKSQGWPGAYLISLAELNRFIRERATKRMDA